MENEHIEKILEDQEKILERMQEENRQLFDAIGVDEATLLDAIHDESKFSHEEWAAMQRRRETLEKTIETRLQAARKSQKPTQAKPEQIQGHWIFVR